MAFALAVRFDSCGLPLTEISRELIGNRTLPISFQLVPGRPGSGIAVAGTWRKIARPRVAREWRFKFFPLSPITAIVVTEPREMEVVSCWNFSKTCSTKSLARI